MIGERLRPEGIDLETRGLLAAGLGGRDGFIERGLSERERGQNRDEAAADEEVTGTRESFQSRGRLYMYSH